MNKKAISPLLSTLVLIFLAIGVGIIVMNWGRTEIEVRAVCAVDTGIKIVELNSVPQACYFGSGENSFIKIVVENGPNIDVHSLLFTVIGSKKPYNTELANSFIEKGYTTQKEIPYNFDLFGKIKRIKIVPKIVVYSGESALLCSEQAIILDNINPC
ncbi:unnamed protein product [marine sediment metagenome]|uniref:Uncharacterized protein n=1 Tax=marine sediment metagenome TaxID=412755 RepID=X0SUM9_9ZZZZ